MNFYRKKTQICQINDDLDIYAMWKGEIRIECVRDGFRRKKMHYKYQALPEIPPFPPLLLLLPKIRATWTTIFQRRNSRFETKVKYTFLSKSKPRWHLKVVQQPLAGPPVHAWVEEVGSGAWFHFKVQAQIAVPSPGTECSRLLSQVRRRRMVPNPNVVALSCKVQLSQEKESLKSTNFVFTLLKGLLTRWDNLNPWIKSNSCEKNSGKK